MRGNHDRWAIEAHAPLPNLSAAALAFLRALPTTWCATIAGVRVVVAHARPGDDMAGIVSTTPRWELEKIMAAADTDLLVVGHTHTPFIRRLHPHARFVVNPGALLRTAPEVPVAMPGTFALLEFGAAGLAAIEIRRALTGEIAMQYRMA